MTRAAYQANGAAIVRAAFYALACDPQRSVVVEACAGAGKTWMLVSRMLRALLEGAAPNEILAITFTRKAAGEMRERLDEWLREFSAPHASHGARVEALVQRGLPPAQAEQLAPRLATLHERILSGGRSVQVSTFHAWFAQLLRAAPLELLNELGLQPEMELIEDLSDHRPEVLRRFHAAVLRDASLHADHSALIARRGRHQAAAWFDAVWDKRVEFELADAAGVLETSVDAPRSAPLHPSEALASVPWQVALADLAASLACGGALARAAGTEIELALELADSVARFEACHAALFTQKGEPRKLGDVAGLAAVQDGLVEIARDVKQWNAHHEHLRMVRLSRVLLAELAAYKRSRGLAEMADLERCGLALLRDATLAAWVQERLDARIRHVLIDEFQDTSPLQWHALHAWLSGYAGAGGGASGQRAPGVFIVGDPKQSIYRFRRAEPRVFDAARGFVVEALGGDALACDHTRRNAPEVLASMNAVFEQAEAAGEFSGFRAHTTELDAAADGTAGVFLLPRVPRPPSARRGAAAAPGEWRDSLTTPRHEPDEILREREAALVAAAIQGLLARGETRPGELFVLSRKRESLRLAAEALRARGVPHAAPEDTLLTDAPEAYDLIALLDALVSPAHRLSLAQALRSPLFGASDAELIELATRAKDGDWWAALVGDDPDRDALTGAALQRARELLPRWREAAAQLPPHDLLDRIVHEGQLRERVAATVPPIERLAALAAIDAVLGQALMLDGARYATPYNFVRALKRRAIRVRAPTQADAVQLLTVHGAKGLEAATVFVMDADPQPKPTETTTLLIDWPVEAEVPRCCAFIYSESACPPSLQPLLDAEVRARQREELNGLYVAMSRAKQRLVFSATEPTRSAGTAWWDRIAPRAAPWPALETFDALNHVGPEAITLKALPPLAPREPMAAPPVGNADTDATRLGKAVHRVLEWATAAGTTAETRGDALNDLATAAAAEFGSPARATARLAEAILNHPTCARFFGGPALRWAGNEVPISDAGEVLRIDRLVQLDDAWWVLDYKLSHTPQALADYRAQLLRYRDAVRRLQPQAMVRCAFIAGSGELIELT